ncbi:MAG TPA: zf-HC2 domain-containing protein [Phycisphaerae bacterium]|nr:zf-HC2 domain-containing protein [Phycisphaerae bacterium]
MNCTTVRKFLYAFADGQLGVKANCEVLDHLKMCPACSRLVDEHQALRSAIGRNLAAEKTPEGLHQRVVQRLEGASARPVPWLRPLAAAACVALAAAGGWWAFANRSADPDQMANAPVRVEGGPTAATMIAEVHRLCLAEPAKHQYPSLPRDRSQVAAAINQHFAGRVAAVAPNLSRFGYEFESVNFCGIDASLSREGGHLVYASADRQSRLSLFCVPRLDRLDQGSGPSPDGYLQYEVDQDGGKKLSILAWHRNSTSYACCANLTIEQLREMVSGIRLAMPNLEDQIDSAVRFAMR